MKRPRRACGALAASLALTWSPAGIAAPGTAAEDLTSLSLEELVDVRVTSVSKKDQRLSEAAAAIFVITAEDLRRSGVTSIPEALRMVPGMEVARINSGSWAVSARGFNSRFATKLLVLVDGRTVYTPLFSGVFWDGLDAVLADIDRIEVIRGPGASLWGANAVNGVINIVTKSAAGTLGGQVTAKAGNVDRGIFAVRYGGELDEQTRYRAYAKAGEQEPSAALGATTPTDHWRRSLAGVRADRAAGNDTFTVQAEAHRSEVGDRIAFGSLVPPYQHTENSPLKNEGAHLRGHWRRQLAADADVSLQVYADHSRIDYFGAVEDRSTFDLEFQRGQRLGAHDVNWGLGYRLANARFDPRSPSATDPFTSVSLDPPHRHLHLWSAFAQDDVTLVPDRLHVVAGARLEHNDFTGLEVQPNLRFTWTPNATSTAWAAVSRAIRSPSMIETDSVVRTIAIPPGSPSNPGPLPILLDVRGSKDFASEVLVAVEGGYRTRLSPTLAVDAAAYYNRYRGLNTAGYGAPAFVPAPVPHLELPVVMGNVNSGSVRGAELAVDWRPLRALRLQGAYTFIRKRVDGADQAELSARDAATPRHQFSLRTGLAPRADVDVDLWVRRVGAIAVEQVAIPAYTAVDVRVAWRPQRRLELALVAQNLADAKHPEFVSDFLASTPTQVRRGLYGMVRWQF